jgi:arabinofuranosyltransferase
MAWRVDRTRALTFVTAAAVVCVVGFMAWKRRWIADDGMIVVRTVLNLLEGKGPTFNAFERCEANTSTLWTYILALLGWITSISIPALAAATGWVFTLAALVIAFDASRRFHRLRGETAPLLPVGGAAVGAMYCYWDYATSGLETGLCWLWIAMAWWCLVTLNDQASRRRLFATAFALGLGPLVRPDFALIAAVFLVAAWLIVRPSLRRTCAAAAVAAGLPIAYEVFRAGYYGILVPMPALAKSASASFWHRGLLYALDFAHPFQLWIPLLVLAGVLGYALAKRRVADRDRIVVLAPLVASALLVMFLVKVGGDFMHGRMMASPFLLAMLPAFFLPVRKTTAGPIAIVLVWAVLVGWIRNDNRNHATSEFVNDERLGYVHYTGSHHPTKAENFIAALGEVGHHTTRAWLEGRHVVLAESGLEFPMDPANHASLVFVAGRLGAGGLVAPRSGIAADTLGLANPIGSRIEITFPDNGPGHQKVLPFLWLIADYGDPALPPVDGTPPAVVAAARHAMRCGDFAEMLASVREPMSASRFWANLVGSVQRTRLQIPSDALLAEQKFCR